MTLPLFVSVGEALTDLIRVGPDVWRSVPGGAPWNVARVLAAWSVPSAFAGAVSRDCFGDALAAASEAAGLDPRFLQQVHAPPLLALVPQLAPPQYFFVGEADLRFEPQQLPEGWLAQAAWVHFGGISLARPPLAGTLLQLARAAKAAGARISYDPNFRNLMDQNYDPMLREMAQLADLIKVSDEDLCGLFRQPDPETGLAELRRCNPQALLLYTRGAAGASLYASEQCVTLAPPRITVVDSVGAGDASLGGLLYSLIRQPYASASEHLVYALAAGAGACLAAGAQVPPLATVQRLAAELLA